MKYLKSILLFTLFTVAVSSTSFAQCPATGFTLSLPGMTGSNTFCFSKPFGVGRNSSNSDLTFGERALLFCAYQSDDAKVRFRFSNYQPMSLEYHGWSNTMLFRMTSGSQTPTLGNEITSWKTAMSIQNGTGKVAIGDVTMPGNYLLYVEKGILAEKVRVALKNTSDWADYVFEKSYEVMPLPAVESFIQKHQHLPGVPSAQEVQNQGIDMAEMDATLLKKIEELTLYAIEQNKQIQHLSEEIRQIKKGR